MQPRQPEAQRRGAQHHIAGAGADLADGKAEEAAVGVGRDQEHARCIVAPLDQAQVVPGLADRRGPGGQGVGATPG